MTLTDTTIEDLVEFHDDRRVPLSSMERDSFKGEFPYYGAQGVIDNVREYRYDGEYVLVAEDGANLVTRNQPISLIATGRFWVNNHAHVIKAREGKSTNWYVCALLNWISIAPYVTGAAQPKLSQKNLRAIRIHVPDYDAQLQITDILSKYDRQIENNRRIALLEEAAQQLYKEWFVRLRFPGHEHTKTVSGLPEGWRKEPLGHALTLQRGFDLPTKNRIEGDIPIYASTGVTGFHNEAKVSGPGVVTGRSGSLGIVNFVPCDYWPLNTTLWVKEFKTVSPWFTVYLLRAMHLEMHGAGVAVPTLNRNDVHRVKVLIPSTDTLNDFDNIVRPMFEFAETLRRATDKLIEARNLLLPRLMSGEIEV